MSFPLFDSNKLESKPGSTTNGSSAQGPALSPPSGTCPPGRPRPTAYLRDLIVILLLILAVAGLLLLARGLPGWL